jgi:hypothetical protein
MFSRNLGSLRLQCVPGKPFSPPLKFSRYLLTSIHFVSRIPNPLNIHRNVPVKGPAHSESVLSVQVPSCFHGCEFKFLYIEETAVGEFQIRDDD